MLCRPCCMCPHRTASRRTSLCCLPDVMSSWKQHRAELDILVCCAASEGHSEDRQAGRHKEQLESGNWSTWTVLNDTPIREVVCWLVTQSSPRVRMSCGGRWWCWLWRWSYSCTLKSYGGCGSKAPHISAPSVARFNAGVESRGIHVLRQGLLPESLQMI
jgi:hypothetical protein